MNRRALNGTCAFHGNFRPPGCSALDLRPDRWIISCYFSHPTCSFHFTWLGVDWKMFPCSRYVHCTGRGWPYDWHGFRAGRPKDSGTHARLQPETGHGRSWRRAEADGQFQLETQISTGSSLWNIFILRVFHLQQQSRLSGVSVSFNFFLSSFKLFVVCFPFNGNSMTVAACVSSCFPRFCRDFIDFCPFGLAVSIAPAAAGWKWIEPDGLLMSRPTREGVVVFCKFQPGEMERRFKWAASHCIRCQIGYLV